MKKTTKAEQRNAWLKAHYARCAALVALCGGNATGKQASAKLVSLERLAHRGAEAQNNGEVFRNYNFQASETAWKRFSAMITERIKDILGAIPPGFFVNGDARGYALKLEPGSVPIEFPRDWGQYQLLSPEIGD